jgi:mannitol/fructose-specific phosphotransferase system IIA component (Ntr-type)
VIQLGELIRTECILLDVEVPTREALFELLVQRLEQQGLVTDRAGVLESLGEREKVMSTGIGGGVAIPHAQSDGARQLTVAVARPAVPLEFDALDEKPVDLIFLVVGPPQRGGFIRILARISRLLCEGEIHERISKAEGPEDVYRLITEQELRLQ